MCLWGSARADGHVGGRGGGKAELVRPEGLGGRAAAVSKTVYLAMATWLAPSCEHG